MAAANQNNQHTLGPQQQDEQEHPLSKNAQKKLLKKRRYEVRKAKRKASLKQKKEKEAQRKKKEWEEVLARCESEEEKQKLIELRKEMRKERMEQRAAEKEKKIERLNNAKENGQKIIIDLEFSHLMNSSEINSLCQQIMYCYALNLRCATPAHLCLTGCQGEMQSQLRRMPGYDKWIIEKKTESYIEVFQNQKEELVYLTADSETMVDELDPRKVYIIGGLVDRNRWKGITMNKAREQGIQTAKLPIGNFLKMSSSQVLTVNQVVEILLKFSETKDWKTSFFAVIPQRKRSEVEATNAPEDLGNNLEVSEEIRDQETKRQCTDTSQTPTSDRSV